MSHRDQQLHRSLKKQLERRRQARPAGPLGLLLTGGTLGLVFVVPVLIGAYLGRWLDSLQPDYNSRWTVSLIVLGIALGAWNVYCFLKGQWK